MDDINNTNDPNDPNEPNEPNELRCTFCKCLITDINDLVTDDSDRLYHEICYDRVYPQ
jgi:hypothetical protein